MRNLKELTKDERVTVRKGGPPDPEGLCVVYWMQRAQRALDNPALNVAIEAANILRKPAGCILPLGSFLSPCQPAQLHPLYVLREHLEEI
jgi:hypothetical protein